MPNYLTTVDKTQAKIEKKPLQNIKLNFLRNINSFVLIALIKKVRNVSW